MKLPIIMKPAEILSQVAKDVEPNELKGFQDLINDMIETTVTSKAAGLAAPQVGVGKRIIVYVDNEKAKVLINPIIVARKKRISSKEKCLSVEKEYIVQRYKYVKVKGLNKAGKRVTVRGKTSALSIRLQHEIDHLDGVTIDEKAFK